MSKKWSLSIGCLKLLEKIFWMKFSGETLSFFFTLINVFLFLDPIKKSSFINFGWPGFHFWFNENSTFWFSPNCSIVCKGNPQHLHSQIPPMTLEFLFKIHFASSLHHHCIIFNSFSSQLIFCQTHFLFVCFLETQKFLFKSLVFPMPNLIQLHPLGLFECLKSSWFVPSLLLMPFSQFHFLLRTSFFFLWKFNYPINL